VFARGADNLISFTQMIDMISARPVNGLAFSVLDLATIAQGRTPADTFEHSLTLARLAEQWGYTRYWLAEHHNSPGVASSATSVLIGYIAGGTSTIRVGSGGIMLPNHSPLVVAEQFGTLASLYPNRIDLGLGRAPGTDQATARAIRGANMEGAQNFPYDVQALQRYFSADNRNAPVRAIPGEGLDIPIWILGSSLDSARVAAAMGLPYAFASHFAPSYFMQAINLYRQSFQPSRFLQKPYVMSGINVVAADTDAEAARLATSVQQFFMGVVTGRHRQLPPPVEVEEMDELWDDLTEQAVRQMLAYSIVGGPDKIRQTLAVFREKTGVDEVMVTAHIYDPAARLRSYELFAEAVKG